MKRPRRSCRRPFACEKGAKTLQGFTVHLAQTAGGSFAFQWAFHPLLAVLFFAIAIALSVYLYRAQRQIASAFVIHTLTVLRLLLILLVFLLLAGPVYQRRLSEKSNGTFILLLDQSGSMSQIDKQATDIERLRWADGLGLLPAGTRPTKLDRSAAELTALRDGAEDLKSRAEVLSTDPADRRARTTLEEAMAAWRDRLNSAAKSLEAALEGQPSADAVQRSLREAAERCPLAVDRAAAADWPGIRARFDAAIAAISPLAEQADREFLKAHADDANVKAALDRVAKMTRAELLRAALTDDAAPRPLLTAARRQDLRLATFAEAAQPIPSGDGSETAESLKKLLTAAGHSTNLAGALGWARQQLSSDEPATVVILSDGRQNTGGDLIEPARLLAAGGARVFTLAVGSPRPVTDAAVERLDAPDWVYKDDTVRGEALVRLDGLAGKSAKVEIRRGDRVVLTRMLVATKAHEIKNVKFEDKPGDAGLVDYEAKVIVNPADAAPDNDRRSTRVSVRDDKLNVLLVDEQPRWEYRFLASTLGRDPRVKLQTVLIRPAQVEQVVRPAPVRASPVNKSEMADLLPDSKEGWSAFDLIILGDVPPESLPPQTQQFIADAVQNRGAALMLVAGQFNMPQRHLRPPGERAGDSTQAKSISDLLPIYPDRSWSDAELAEHVRRGFRPRLAAESGGSVLSQLSVDESLATRLWSATPKWFWHSAYTRAKPGASVLWTIGDAAAPASTRPADAAADLEAARRQALLVTMPLGAGRVMYLASDQTWRLRQVGGEDVHERFWGQAIRWAAGDDLPAGGRFARFGADKPRYAGGEPIHLRARLTNPKTLAPLTERRGLKVVAKQNGKQVAEAPLVESPQSPGLYQADLLNAPSGNLELSLEGDEVAALLSADPDARRRTLEVSVLAEADLEHQNVNTDPAALASVAAAADGVALDLAYADVLAEHLPALSHGVERVEQFGLFTDPRQSRSRTMHGLLLLAFATLITAEWVIRKMAGLV